MSNYETLQKYTIAELRLTLSNLGGAPNNKKKHELIDEILKIESGEISAKRSNRGRPSERAKRGENGEYYFSPVKPHHVVLNDRVTDQPLTPEHCAGYLEVVSQSYGFLHAEDYLKESAIYVPLPLIKANNLRTGDFVEGSGVLLADKRIIELEKVDKVNGHEPSDALRTPFYNKTALCPTKQIVLGSENSALKVIDVACPIGKGQRVLVSSKSARQTKDFTISVLNALQSKADVKTILYLADERPEQINFYKTAYPCVEVMYSAFDKDHDYRAHVGEMAFSRATALCEDGNDVVIIVDSLSKLLKACLGVGGVYQSDLTAKHKAIGQVLKYFGLARNFEKGSLTVIGIVAEDWDFEVSKILNTEAVNLANCKVTLDEFLYEEGVIPGVDILNSYTEDHALMSTGENSVLALRLVKKALRNGQIEQAEASKIISELTVSEIIDKFGA